MDENLALDVGIGYWLIDNYPIGGCFRRVHNSPMDIHSPKEIKASHGCKCKAVITETGENIAWSGQGCHAT